MRYTVIHSDRKSVAIQIKSDGTVVVRAPYRVSEQEIEVFVAQKQAWIESHLKKMQAAREALPDTMPFTREQIEQLAQQALTVIPERVRHYAPLVGVTYGRITIRNQRSKWGSCSGKGNLNFNCLLMLMPREILDSVVVHELCHRKHMDHSPAFYAEVRRVFPDYDRCSRWLKDHGNAYLSRLR
ncbi:MAG: M48 family metallopeptidase [Oscillospiraceae bacterium]|nr:M48 family metallopeptidase [Oscillospiraceae bacterium]